MADDSTGVDPQAVSLGKVPLEACDSLLTYTLLRDEICLYLYGYTCLFVCVKTQSVILNVSRSSIMQLISTFFVMLIDE